MCSWWIRNNGSLQKNLNHSFEDQKEFWLSVNGKIVYKELKSTRCSFFHVSFCEVALNRCHLCDPTTWTKNKPLSVMRHAWMHLNTHTHTHTKSSNTVLHSRCVGFSGASVLLQSYTGRWKSSKCFKKVIFLSVLLHSTESFLLGQQKRTTQDWCCVSLLYLCGQWVEKQLTMQDEAYLEKQIYKHRHIFCADHCSKAWLIVLDLYKHYQASLGLSVWWRFYRHLLKGNKTCLSHAALGKGKPIICKLKKKNNLLNQAQSTPLNI